MSRDNDYWNSVIIANMRQLSSDYWGIRWKEPNVEFFNRTSSNQFRFPYLYFSLCYDTPSKCHILKICRDVLVIIIRPGTSLMQLFPRSYPERDSSYHSIRCNLRHL